MLKFLSSESKDKIKIHITSVTIKRLSLLKFKVKINKNKNNSLKYLLMMKKRIKFRIQKTRIITKIHLSAKINFNITNKKKCTLVLSNILTLKQYNHLLKV